MTRPNAGSAATRPRRERSAVLALVAYSGVVLSATGCGGQGAASPKGDDLRSNRAASIEPVNTGLAALTADGAADAPTDTTNAPLIPPQSDEDKLAASSAAAASLRAAITETNQVAPPPTVPAREPATVAVEPAAPLPEPGPRVTTLTRARREPTAPAAVGPAMASGGAQANPSPTALTPAVQAANDAWTDAGSRAANVVRAQSTDPATPTVAVAPTPSTPADPLVELGRQMAALLRAGPSAPGEKDRAALDAAALAPIEAMRPGVLADLDSASSALAALPHADRALLAAARDRLGGRSAASEAGDALRRTLAPGLAPVVNPDAAPLRIPRAALCARVESFGKFSPLTTNNDTFAAGRAIRAIVYTELDGFAARPAREGDRLVPGAPASEQISVDLQQSLALFQDSTGLRVWSRPAQNVVETSRNKRRDFYLIQQVELPRTLGVGRYNLKVTVKDRTTGAETEAILPISVVAP